ncbi:MAG TPA: FtsX-like permease family protein, partial [Candidatus Limnocylindria bacterium]|nr:FtsX-like permease family protein [Candidatus Limnocylindria bacterium]
RRPSQSPARRTLWLGLGMIAVSIGLTIAGANLRNQSGDNLNVYLLIGGAVLGTLGFGACSPWLLERLEGIASRLPVAGRIAFRDTARARSRSSPIATAILSSLAAVIAIGAFSATRDAESLASWRPQMHADQLLIDGAGSAAAGADLLAEPGVVGGLAISHLAQGQQVVGEISYELPDAHDANGKLINLIDNCDNCNPDAFQPYVAFNPAAATPELLAMAHATDGAADLRAGRALLLTADPITATVMKIEVRDIETGGVTKTLTLPVRVIDVGVRSSHLPDSFLPDATVKELELTVSQGGESGGPEGFLVQFDHPVAEADITHAREVAARYPDTAVSTDSAPVRPGEGFRLVLIALVLLFAVSVTAIAIALGEAESRPEQRSLLALGADPGLRRRIAASRAAVLALLAGLLAVPAGLLPIWGIFTSRGSRMEIPMLEIAGAVVLLPLLAVASGWLLSRPIPDWNAFRRSGAGD